jgi:hypothetical protein
MSAITLDTLAKAIILAFGILGGCIATGSGVRAFVTYVDGQDYGLADEDLRAELAHAVDFGLLEGFVFGLPYGIYAFILATAGVLSA